MRSERVGAMLAATRTIAFLVALLAGASGCFTSSAEAAGLSYKQGVIEPTTYGEVAGATVNDGKTLLWRGIPYGKAPVGPLRWKAPQKPDAWQGVFDAAKAGAPGIQLVGAKIIGSEDCLNLRYLSPQLRRYRVAGPDLYPRRQ